MSFADELRGIESGQTIKEQEEAKRLAEKRREAEQEAAKYRIQKEQKAESIKFYRDMLLYARKMGFDKNGVFQGFEVMSSAGYTDHDSGITYSSYDLRVIVLCSPDILEVKRKYSSFKDLPHRPGIALMYDTQNDNAPCNWSNPPVPDIIEGCIARMSNDRNKYRRSPEFAKDLEDTLNRLGFSHVRCELKCASFYERNRGTPTIRKNTYVPAYVPARKAFKKKETTVCFFTCSI